MAIVYMMIGIPGLGKTTYARKISKEKGLPIISTDEVRNMHPNWEEAKIWPEVYRLCGEYLKAGQSIIFDATNITPAVRKRFIENVQTYYQNFDLYAYVMKASLNDCLTRVEKRNLDPNERYLPLDVIPSYYHKLIEPTYEEGFTKIKIINN